jgi:hypothetical protein
LHLWIHPISVAAIVFLIGSHTLIACHMINLLEDRTMKKLSLLLIALAAATSSCTWVKVSEQASNVAVANAANVRGCKHMSEISVSVPNKVGFIQRDADKVATELATMARNEAAGDGGDTVVPSSGIENGRQSFNVYKCSKK